MRLEDLGSGLASMTERLEERLTLSVVTTMTKRIIEERIDSGLAQMKQIHSQHSDGTSTALTALERKAQEQKLKDQSRIKADADAFAALTLKFEDQFKIGEQSRGWGGGGVRVRVRVRVRVLLGLHESSHCPGDDWVL